MVIVGLTTGLAISPLSNRTQKYIFILSHHSCPTCFKFYVKVILKINLLNILSYYSLSYH